VSISLTTLRRIVSADSLKKAHALQGRVCGQAVHARRWQRTILRDLFGTNAKTTPRRYRTMYLSCGKGNGKSPLAAGIGLYLHLSATVSRVPRSSPPLTQSSGVPTPYFEPARLMTLANP
jgi:phage terminase large subunit-like protein